MTYNEFKKLVVGTIVRVHYSNGETQVEEYYDESGVAVNVNGVDGHGTGIIMLARRDVGQPLPEYRCDKDYQFYAM